MSTKLVSETQADRAHCCLAAASATSGPAPLTGPGLVGDGPQAI